MNNRHAFIMMVQNKYWNEFRRRQQQGEQTHAYVNRGTAGPKNTSIVMFYVTKPVGEIAGYAEFIERKTGDSETLWNAHGQETVLNSKEQFEEFVKDRSKVSLVRFRNLHEATKPIPLNNLLLLLGMKRLGRGGFFVDKETAEKMIALME